MYTSRYVQRVLMYTLRGANVTFMPQRKEKKSKYIPLYPPLLKGGGEGGGIIFESLKKSFGNHNNNSLSL